MTQTGTTEMMVDGAVNEKSFCMSYVGTSSEPFWGKGS